MNGPINQKSGLHPPWSTHKLPTLFRSESKFVARWLQADIPLKRLNMVKIRLKRMGSKNRPYYRVVVADSRSPRDGKCIEEIGTYAPMREGENYDLKLDRVDYWLGVGARPSDTVSSFIKKARKAATAAAEA